MFFYKLDYTIEKVLEAGQTPEQAFLKKYLNAALPAGEAKYLWEKIVDHKWYVSERLKRDVGFRVAAIDYVENFHAPGSVFGSKNNKSGIFGKVFRPINSTVRSYFVSKSKVLPQ